MIVHVLITPTFRLLQLSPVPSIILAAIRNCFVVRLDATKISFVTFGVVRQFPTQELALQDAVSANLSAQWITHCCASRHRLCASSLT